MKSNQVRKLSAVAGAGAVVAMGVLTVMLGSQQEPRATFVSDPTEMTLGETSTTTTGVTEIPTSVATPPVTATTPEGMTPP